MTRSLSTTLAAAMLWLATMSHAFVSRSTTTRLSFVPKTVDFFSSSSRSYHYNYYSTTTTSTRTSAVTMNLFDRFTRVVNANLNNILKNLEDPEKIMNQALEDMQVIMCENERVVYLAVFAFLSRSLYSSSFFPSLFLFTHVRTNNRVTWSKSVNPTPK
jgi:hypothetical protein